MASARGGRAPTEGGRRAASSTVDVDLEQRLWTAVDEVFEGVVIAFQEGVRLDSRNPADGGPGEADFQRRYADLLRDGGARVEMFEIDEDALRGVHPWLDAQVDRGQLAGRPTVIGWLPSSQPAEGMAAHLILNSHADTVGVTEPGTWQRPPHGGEIADGELHGLGSLDAKANLFAYLGVVRALRRAGVVLARPAVIESVVDEEVSGAGTLECLRRGYTATAAIVGEPTDLSICPGSRGKATVRLVVEGLSAHPGEGWRGVNAIRKAWLYVEALERLRERLERTRMHPLWAGLPAGHVWNLMALSSGPAGRAVPARCEVVYGIGTIGTERLAEIRPMVEEALAAVTAGDPWLAAHPPSVAWRGLSMEAAVSDPGHPAVVAMVNAGRRVVGHVPEVSAASVATDGRHLVNEGGIPAINFGPGATRRAHSPNESMPLDDLRRAISWLALFLVEYCGVSDGRQAGGAS